MMNKAKEKIQTEECKVYQTKDYFNSIPKLISML